MLYTISGPSSVGKSIGVENFITHCGFMRYTPYTTREKRACENEQDGKEYFFSIFNKLKEISKNFSIGYWDFIFDNVYGYTKEISKCILVEQKYIILATVNIALQIKRDHHSIKTVFIDFENPLERKRRITDRFYPNTTLVEQKLKEAKKIAPFKPYFDIAVIGDNPYGIYETLKDILQIGWNQL